MLERQMKVLIYGLLCGIIGGSILAIILLAMDKLTAIGELFHISGDAGELSAHLLICALIGLSFAFIFQKLIRGLLSGLLFGIVYGIIWWFIGPVTLVPAIRGAAIDSAWNMAGITAASTSLFGFIIFGFILGIVFGFFKKYPLHTSTVKKV